MAGDDIVARDRTREGGALARLLEAERRLEERTEGARAEAARIVAEAEEAARALLEAVESELADEGEALRREVEAEHEGAVRRAREEAERRARRYELAEEEVGRLSGLVVRELLRAGGEEEPR